MLLQMQGQHTLFVKAKVQTCKDTRYADADVQHTARDIDCEAHSKIEQVPGMRISSFVVVLPLTALASAQIGGKSWHLMHP
jgi:hypothetical protein